MGDGRKCQTYTASPAEPGGLPVMLALTTALSRYMKHVELFMRKVAAGGESRIKAFGQPSIRSLLNPLFSALLAVVPRLFLGRCGLGRTGRRPL